MRQETYRAKCLLIVLSIVILCLARCLRAQGNQTIYSDTLSNTWQNWSWCLTDFQSADAAHSGSKSLKVTYNAAWEGLYLHTNPPPAPYSTLVFWIHGGVKSGRRLAIAGVLNNAVQPGIFLAPFINGGQVEAGKWNRVIVPLSAISLSNTPHLSGFQILEASGNQQPAFYLDDIVLVPGAVPLPPAPPASLSAAGGIGQIGLTWTASSGASSYTIKRSLTNGGPYTTLASGLTSLACIDASVQRNITYYYTVTATSAAGESGLSMQASAAAH